MPFCTKCGRPLAEGEICDCQKQQAAPSEQGGFNPYGNPQPEKTIQADSENVVINIDKDKMKQNLNNAVDKLQTGVGKGVDMVNETRNKYESSGAFEHGLKIVPDCISANDGEIPIKQYDFAKLRTRLMLEKSYGRLQITNKRVIFRAAGRSPLGKNIFHQEFSIDQLAGVEVRCKHEFNLFNFFLGLIFSLAIGGACFAANYQLDSAAAVSFIFAFLVLVACGIYEFYCHKNFESNKLYTVRQLLLSAATGGMIGAAFESDSVFIFVFTAIMCLAALINLVLMSIVQNLVAIFKTGAAAAIEIKREPVLGLLSFLFLAKEDKYSGFAEILPWTDTDIAIKEVGTIIDDIKTMGDAAIEKWKQD
jgi:hypothetical protein